MLCDPDMQVAEKAASEFAKKYGRTPKIEQDLRRVFDNKDIDAVTVATPNHWHSLATIWACQAGKDVYVEKPGQPQRLRRPEDGRGGHASTTGSSSTASQFRSSEAVREAVDHLRKGHDRQGLHGPRTRLPPAPLDRPRQGPGHRRRRPRLGHLARPRAGAAVLASGSSTTTGTGTGITATATSATRASTRPTCASGAWAWRRCRRRSRRHGRQVPVRRRQGDARSPLQQLPVPRDEAR